MASRIPHCSSCDFCHKEPLSKSGKLYDLCHHPTWRFSAIKARWIKCYDRGKTSPKWCPLRKSEHHIHENKEEKTID